MIVVKKSSKLKEEIDKNLNKKNLKSRRKNLINQSNYLIISSYIKIHINILANIYRTESCSLTRKKF
jgi:hypothetical protein